MRGAPKCASLKDVWPVLAQWLVFALPGSNCKGESIQLWCAAAQGGVWGLGLLPVLSCPREPLPFANT